MYVPVKPGVNKIHMSYFPPYMGIGIMITVIAIIAFILISKTMRGKASIIDRPDKVILYVYETVFVVALLVVYIIPAFAAVRTLL